jgi:hypothetical protein
MDQIAAHQDATAAVAPEHFRTGIDDIVILPLVVITLAVAKLLKALFTLLIHFIDFLFPILLQLMRFPLFTLRILGDGIVALTKAIVAILPIGSTRRATWRKSISLCWTWLRQRFSYHAFEEWIHHAFEKGMAWVFQRCRTLTPRRALLVIFGAILWLPISFGAATLLHAVLIAKATTWPAWAQFLHPFATIIAKSKLLVLPVYPAAWPQAKKHPLLQAMFEFWRFVASRYLSRKTAARYRQTEHAWDGVVEPLARTSTSLGLTSKWNRSVDTFNAAAFELGSGTRVVLLWLVELLATISLFRGIVRRYEAQYNEVSQHPKPPVSERVSDFYARWSVKFTAKYYEDREREEAKVHTSSTGPY